MKARKILTLVLLMGITACDEFTPVFTGKYADPEPYKVYTEADFEGKTFITIADLKKLYVNSPVDIVDDIYIKGQVISSDKSGNLYRVMYIQDESAGIEIKMGKTGLYNDYKQGQWVYVSCRDLTLGDYRTMKGLGYKSNDSEYETSYIDVQELIDLHVFRGEIDTMPDPIPLDVLNSDYKQETGVGMYVKLNGLEYKNEIFALLYFDPNGDRKDYSGNALFLASSEGEDYAGKGNCGIDTWAMSEQGFDVMLAGNFGGAITDNTASKFVSGAAYSISQYFTLDGTDVQVRSSGYARFADTSMGEHILSGKPVNLTGILTTYDGKYQFTLIDLDDIEYVTE